jgi:hypothetical protein
MRPLQNNFFCPLCKFKITENDNIIFGMKEAIENQNKLINDACVAFDIDIKNDFKKIINRNNLYDSLINCYSDIGFESICIELRNMKDDLKIKLILARLEKFRQKNESFE